MTLGAGMLASVVAWAGPSVTYVATPGGGISWSYDYTVTGPIDQFGVVHLVFDFASYANLASTSIDPSITSPINQPDPVGHFPGDVYATFMNAALPDGNTATFSVSFDWSGNGTPGSQPFDIFDANGNPVVQDGNTTVTGSGPSQVPEPSDAALAVAALLALSLARRRAA